MRTLNTSDFPHLDRGEIAFRGVRSDETLTDAYAQASGFLAGETAVESLYFAEGVADGVEVAQITVAELNRIARAEARAAGFAGAVWRQVADNLDTVSAGPTAALLRESEHPSAAPFLDGLGKVVDGVRRGDADRVSSGVAVMLYEAQRLDYGLRNSERRRNILESAVTRAAEAGAMTSEQRSVLETSPMLDGRGLFSALGGLRNAAPGNIGGRIESVVRTALALHATAALATERAHKLATDAAEYRRQRDEEGARAVKAERGELVAFAAAKRLVGELSGWSLGMLPAGAYGVSIVQVVADTRKELGL